MKDSRQVRRYNSRKDAYAFMAEHYPGEPRKRRRAMALALSKRWYKGSCKAIGA